MTEKQIGSKLIIYIISRINQIYFKLYAAVDQCGGYHVSDLDELSPTDDELYNAANWSMSHDPSDGYRLSPKAFLKEFGYEGVAEKL